MSGALAVILARRGSKGVPGKNVARLRGRPCIEWTIEQALASRLVSWVLVSSDDPAALACAGSMGVDTIDRPPELATDTARVDDALRHAFEEFARGRRGMWTPKQPVVMLYANVPVRPAGLIDRALELLEESGCDSVQSYAPVGKYHPWWITRLDEQGVVRPWEGNVLNHGVFRRQDLPPAFVPDGGVSAVTKESLFLEVAGVAPGPHAFFGADRRGVINPEGSVIDIDTPKDLMLAEAALR